MTEMMRQLESDLMARVKENREYQMSLWKQMEEDKQKENRFGFSSNDDSS
jgi:hypothetical protein